MINSVYIIILLTEFHNSDYWEHGTLINHKLFHNKLHTHDCHVTRQCLLDASKLYM